MFSDRWSSGDCVQNCTLRRIPCSVICDRGIQKPAIIGNKCGQKSYLRHAIYSLICRRSIPASSSLIVDVNSLINVKCKWCKYKIVLPGWTLSLSPPTRHIPDEKFLITIRMMENGNLDKLTFYNLHFHTNWATFRPLSSLLYSWHLSAVK